MASDWWQVSDSRGHEIGVTEAGTPGTAVQIVVNKSQENRAKAVVGGGAYARRLTAREMQQRGLVSGNV